MHVPAPSDFDERAWELLRRGRHPRFWVGQLPDDEAVYGCDDLRGLNVRITNGDGELFLIDVEAGTVVFARHYLPRNANNRRGKPLSDPRQLRRAVELLLAELTSREQAQLVKRKAKDARRDAVLAERERRAAIRACLRQAESRKLGILGRVELQPMSDRDVLLALQWYHGEDRSRLASTLVRHTRAEFCNAVLDSDHATLSRLFSARAAELAAAAWLRARRALVQDVAILQLDTDSPGSWSTHDLRVSKEDASSEVIPDFVTQAEAGSSLRIDVKSSRRPMKRHGATQQATRACVRKIRPGIAILGMLADYADPRTLLGTPTASGDAGAPEFAVLGWTSASRIADLGRWTSAGNLTLKDRSEKIFPAPWLYELPPITSASDWPGRELAGLLGSDETVERALNLDYLEAAGLSLTFERRDECLAPDVGAFGLFQDCRNGFRRFGRSLPVLYLAILRHFIRFISTSATGNDCGWRSPADYGRFLWPLTFQRDWMVAGDTYRSGRERSFGPSPEADVRSEETDERRRPLGIPDPEGSILHLVSALERLWVVDPEALRCYDQFAVSSSSILRARHKRTGDRHTLLAYCGGSDKKYGPCGAFPLLLGIHRHCNNGRLTCSCGYCCPICAETQRQG